MKVVLHILRKTSLTSTLCCFLFWVGAQKAGSDTKYLQQDEVQLSKPVIDISNIFFTQNILLSYGETPKDCTLKYKFKNEANSDWTTPPEKGLKLNKSAHLLFKYTSNQDYLDSEEIELEVKKVDKQCIQEIEFLDEPSSNYSGQGQKTLLDQVKASSNFKDGKWLGFNRPTITLGVSLKKKKCIESICISSLQNQGAWIFLPHKIEVYHQDKRIAYQEYNGIQNESNAKSQLLHISIPKVKTEELRIKISALDEIPEWHPGHGTIPWFFIDEIIVE